MQLIILVSLFAAGPVPVEELSAREGDVEVIGRYGECLDQQLTLRGSTIRFVLPSEESAKTLFGLRAGIDRLIIKGRFTDKDTIAVMSVEKTETEAQVYSRRSEGLNDSSAALRELGSQAMQRAAALGDAELKEVACSILRKAFLATKEQTPADDAAAHLAWVKDMLALLGDAKWAIEEVRGRLTRDPAWVAGIDFLRSLGCIQWHNNWYTRDDFLQTQGLVQVDGKWRLPEEIAFEGVVARLARLKRNQEILRTRTDQAYKVDAERGALAVGMTRQEAVKAWGFPDDVRRIQHEGCVIDQWRYGERLVYLLDDYVALLPVDKKR